MAREFLFLAQVSREMLLPVPLQKEGQLSAWLMKTQPLNQNTELLAQKM
jgi:hypothetical protein